MTRSRLFAALALALLTGPPASAGGGRPLSPLPQPLPGPLNAPQHPALLTALTTDAAGAPVVAWLEHGPDTASAGAEQHDHLRAARWNGTRWVPLPGNGPGGILNEDARHTAFQLTARRGPDGQPWLGWAEDAGTAHVDSYLLSRWDGARWSDSSRYAVRRNLSDAGKSRAFAVTGTGAPFLAWVNIYYPGAHADVVQPFRWLGTRFDQNAPPLNTTIERAAFFPAAARGPAAGGTATGGTGTGTLYAAWLEGDFARSDVLVASQPENAAPGTPWTLLGGPLNVRPQTFTFAPQLAATAAGPVAAWLEDDGGHDGVFVKRWNGREWVGFGETTDLNADPRHSAERPALALDARGLPVIAWSEGGVNAARQVYARRWTGQRWALLGGGPLNLNPQHDASGVSVTVDGQGRALVSWVEWTRPGPVDPVTPPPGQRDVVVRRFP